MTDRAGQLWVVDPAAYGGHREVDLAMLSLFGQPGRQFFAAYEEVTPLADGWRDRLRLWQLEPILVHATLFGGAYGSQAVDILRHFT
jgi:fructosamine-3-kinase